MGGKISIDRSRCTGCGRCVEASFAGDLIIGTDGKPEYAIEDVTCIDCGHCVAVCPTGAISHREFARDGFAPVDRADGLTYEGLMVLLKTRRSRREFLDTPVSDGDTAKLLDAAAQAPTAMNRQTMEYSFVTDRAVIRAMAGLTAEFMARTVKMARNPIGRMILRLMARGGYDDVVSMLPKMERISAAHSPESDTILYNTPCAILLHAPSGDTCGAVNACYHASNILLAAETLGLGACLIGFLVEAAARETQIRRLARIPSGHTVHAVVAVGHPKFSYPTTIPKPKPRIHRV